MKKLFFALLRWAGVARLVAWFYRRRVVFLCYHSVTKWPHPFDEDPELHTPHESFAAQLDYLKRRHNVITLGEYLGARREGRRLPDYSAVLTFDDGTRNFLTVVAPLLAERGLSAAAFVITEKTGASDGAGAGREWTREDDDLYLSWDEVRDLARRPGIEIGSHSHTHPDLTQLPAEAVRRELAESLAAVAEQTGNAAPALSYPHGRANAGVREMARSLGYACAFTGELGANDMQTDLYGLRRVVIAGDDDLSTFVARVSGVTWWSERVRAALRRVGVVPAHEDARVVQMKKSSPGSIP